MRVSVCVIYIYGLIHRLTMTDIKTMIKTAFCENVNKANNTFCGPKHLKTDPFANHSPRFPQ